MPLPCTDIPAPAQGHSGISYDQSLTGRQRHRQRLAQKRKIAAYARLVLAVAEKRRLADAELRDLMNAQPDDARRGDVLLDLAEGGLVRWEDVGRSLELHPGMWEAAGLDRDPDAGRQLDLPLAETSGRDAP